MYLTYTTCFHTHGHCEMFATIKLTAYNINRIPLLSLTFGVTSLGTDDLGSLLQELSQGQSVGQGCCLI